MENAFNMSLSKIQPSQLYISEEKLTKVENYLSAVDIKEIEPLPIKKIGNNVFFTDGHTRAFALYKMGIDEVKVYWDEDDLGWIEYLVCLNWCNNVGIKDISDLKGRIIDNEAYQLMWLERCGKMQEDIKQDLYCYMEIKEVVDSNIKSEICEMVLRSLPEWFGIEESIKEYVHGVKESYFMSVYIGNIPIGFISLIEHNEYTSEIYVLGILPEFHNKGIGRKLILKVEEYLIHSNKKFLTVKTLSDSHPDKHYKKTRNFYNAMGFYPIEEFKTLWGEANPCLFMLKELRCF